MASPTFADTESQLAKHEEWLEVAEQHQLDTRLLTSSEVDALIPGLPGHYAGGLHTPSDARAEPFVAVPALARAVRREGGRIIENCAVRGIEFEAGAVSGVVTELGPVRTRAAVCACGAWSSLLLRHLGLDLPQLTFRATVARTAPAPEFYDGNASAPGFGFRRRQDGGYTVSAAGTNDHFVGLDSFRYFSKFLHILKANKGNLRLQFGGVLGRMRPRTWRDDGESPFEHDRVLNPPPSDRALRRLDEAIRNRVPVLEGIPFVESWAGMIDMTPDIVPVLDEVDDRPGLFVATGFSGHGFGIGPGAGRVMASLVLGESPGHDLTRFRFSRFHDGTPLRVGPGI